MTLSEAKAELRKLMSQYNEGLITLSELKAKALDVICALYPGDMCHLLEVIS